MDVRFGAATAAAGDSTHHGARSDRGWDSKRYEEPVLGLGGIQDFSYGEPLTARLESGTADEDVAIFSSSLGKTPPFGASLLLFACASPLPKVQSAPTTGDDDDQVTKDKRTGYKYSRAKALAELAEMSYKIPEKGGGSRIFNIKGLPTITLFAPQNGSDLLPAVFNGFLRVKLLRFDPAVVLAKHLTGLELYVQVFSVCCSFESSKLNSGGGAISEQHWLFTRNPDYDALSVRILLAGKGTRRYLGVAALGLRALAKNSGKELTFKLHLRGYTQTSTVTLSCCYFSLRPGDKERMNPEEAAEYAKAEQEHKKYQQIDEGSGQQLPELPTGGRGVNEQKPTQETDDHIIIPYRDPLLEGRGSGKDVGGYLDLQIKGATLLGVAKQPCVQVFTTTGSFYTTRPGQRSWPPTWKERIMVWTQNGRFLNWIWNDERFKVAVRNPYDYNYGALCVRVLDKDSKREMGVAVLGIKGLVKEGAKEEFPITLPLRGDGIPEVSSIELSWSYQSCNSSSSESSTGLLGKSPQPQLEEEPFQLEPRRSILKSFLTSPFSALLRVARSVTSTVAGAFTCLLKQKLGKQDNLLDLSEVSKKLGYEALALMQCKETDTQAWLFRSSDCRELAIAFRGTEFTSLKNWMSDISFSPRTFTLIANSTTEGLTTRDPREKDKELVHRGFFKAYTNVRRMLTWLLIEAASDARKVLSTNIRGAKVELNITGHSLGGALATLAAFELGQSKEQARFHDIHLYTFGSPRVGNQKFQEAFEQRVRSAWRFTNHLDIVPSLPPERWWIKYRHVHTAVRLPPLVDDKNGILKKIIFSAPKDIPEELSKDVSYPVALFMSGINVIKHHKMESYKAALDARWKQQAKADAAGKKPKEEEATPENACNINANSNATDTFTMKT